MGWCYGIQTVNEESVSISFKYKGPLPSGGRKSPRSKEKQLIRRQLNLQIAKYMENPPPEIFGLSTSNERKSIGTFVFQPIICKGRGISCELEIKVFSRTPFGTVYSHGDLDNRIKTLFDALCTPNKDQLTDTDSPTDKESLFWILLEDDSLITDFSVKTEPLFTEGKESEVEVDIAITIKRPGSLFR